METTVEGEDRVLATAQKIVESLNASQDVTDDMLLILSSFDNRLSNISDLISDPHLKKPSNVPLFSRLTHAEKIVVSHLAPNIPLFDDNDDACEFLYGIDELIDVIGGLYALEPAPVEWIDRAESAVQSAMTKLEDELRRVVVANTIRLDAEKLYGCINSATETMSFGSHDGDVKIVHQRGGSLAADVWIDVVNEDAVSTIRDIVDRMVRAKYEKECCQVYSSCRREGLEECLGILGIERLSIEEVQRIEWKELDEKMKRWVQVVKIVVRLVLNSEKRLCESIFDGVHCDLIREVCFVEAAKMCVLQLLNFGEAVAIGKRSPEKLFRILDMYEGLSDTLRYLRSLFSDESGEFVIAEAVGVLDALGEAAKSTFSEFEVAVKGEASKRPVQGGEIHPLSRYVMNYVKLLVEYGETLNMLLEDDVKEGGDGKETTMSPLGMRLASLIGSLESNIEEKAKLYEDNALQYVFLMNNKLYVVQKVKDSELGKLLGDDFVKSRRGIIRKYATHYLRASWSKVLACLRDEGIGSGSSSSAKMALKERFKNFNASFEEIYRAQTSWKVPDSQLRTELRISISERVIPAYRSFLGRFGPQLESGRHAGKYIKYTAEDLDGYLADLFEGTPGVLNHMRRKSS
ncbi:exocyst complex component EXO70B1 [Silene latifolia]|uniref:exocyst complex component EXO70B1 n=1 Tax=Silene latifolia TaxID=37657 RepID=UPI003D777033